IVFFFSSRRRHTRSKRDWSSDVCSSDLEVFLGNGVSELITLCLQAQGDELADAVAEEDLVGAEIVDPAGLVVLDDRAAGREDPRSEERRGGREGRSERGRDEGNNRRGSE